MDDVDFYKILEVDKNASDDEIKKAFRRFSKKYHPDMQHGKSDAEKKAAEETFKKGQAAYECLSDPEKRKIYDEYGIDGLKGHAQQDGGFSGMPGNLSDFLKRHFGFSWGFGDDDGGFNPFGRQNRRKTPSINDPEDGKSYRIRMEVDLEDVIFGAEKEFTMDGFKICPDCHGHKCDGYEDCPICHGTGMVSGVRGNMIFQNTCPTCGGNGYSQKNTCSTCNGEGRIQGKRQYKVKIPIGLSEGTQLRVRGGGVPGLNGGADGDLYMVITTKKHPIFRRRQRFQNDLGLETDIYINPLIAICGGTVSIPTPYEMKTQYIAAGINNGFKFDIPEAGIRAGNISGPLTVNIIYDTLNPSFISDEDKKVLKAAKEIIDKNPDCLVNLKRQIKDLNNDTKLPWIVNIEK